MILKDSLKARHIKSAGAIAYVSVIDDKTLDHGIGTAFHVGDGLFVTAKHVVEGKEIIEVATTKRAIKIYDKDTHYLETRDYINPQKLKVISGPEFSTDENSSDVAVFKVDLDGLDFPRLIFDSFTNHDIDDSSFLLENILVIGYPPIPLTNIPIQMASLGQVNAVIDVRHSKHPHFIISSLARGGYSGGPAISEDGKVIGIVTESLVHNNTQAESGFMSVICSEAVILEIQKHYKFNAEENGVFWNYDLTVEIKLCNSNKKANELNPRIPDAVISVTDIDPDACGYIECDDPDILDAAEKIISGLCVIYKSEEFSNAKTFSFYSDTYGEELRSAALYLRDFFIGKGYYEMSGKDGFNCDE